MAHLESRFEGHSHLVAQAVLVANEEPDHARHGQNDLLPNKNMGHLVSPLVFVEKSVSPPQG